MSKADLIDNVLAPGGMVGKPTPRWRDSYDHAVKRMKLGGSFTVFKAADGSVIRYTIHVAGYPYKLTTEDAERLIKEVPMEECWHMSEYGRIDFDGGLFTLYQVPDGVRAAYRAELATHTTDGSAE